MTDIELDNLIAKKIMAAEKICDGFEQTNFEPLFSFNGGLAERVPEFSNDVSYAFVIIEKLREKNISISVAQVLHVKDNSWEYLAKAEFFGSDRFEFSTDKSVARAICITALKAIEDEQNS